MKFWIIYLYLSIICILFFVYNLYLKKKIKTENYFEEELKKLPCKFYMENKNKILTNIKEEELKYIKSNIANEILFYDGGKIEKTELGFFIEKEAEQYDEVEKLKDEIEEEHTMLIKEKDENYYLQKESAMKLGFILQELYELKNSLISEESLKYAAKIEAIESKLEFFVSFIYGKINIKFRKYKVSSIENIIKLFENIFKDRVEFKLEEKIQLKEKIFFEEEKFYHLFKAVISSIVTKRKGKALVEVIREEKLLKFKISVLKSIKDGEASNDEEFFQIYEMHKMGWKMFVTDNGEYIVEIPLNRKIIEGVKEEKEIEISSDLRNIKSVDKNIIYDMYSKGFSEKESCDVKLILDELLTNAIEHGNKYNISKKVVINYRFQNLESELFIEIADEGDGFLPEKLKEIDNDSERGRGIFIVRKLADSLEYSEDGKIVSVCKKRSIKNDSEQL